jgi:spore maturation protein CgeB
VKIVVFGLSVTSSWGNRHATLWRGLGRALAARGHRLAFYERSVPYYAAHRDLPEPPGIDVRLYEDFAAIAPAARRELDEADVAMVTSYCPDGVAATELAQGSRAPLRVFYDLDTPVTLERLAEGAPVPYIGPDGLRPFHLTLSFTGGTSLEGLRARLGARRALPLYGSVDPAVHRPAPPLDRFAADISYLGTYAADRQAALDALFLEPARRAPDLRFIIGGSMYPPDFPWAKNLWYVPHVAPPDHAAFYCSSPLTLNVTRAPMAASGFCPSGRLFEAAACGTAILSDDWPGLDGFFAPGAEILIASTPEEALAAIACPRAELRRIARAARERTLAEHTADRRAAELEDILCSAGNDGLSREE